jgi:hypothetical protein
MSKTELTILILAKQPLSTESWTLETRLHLAQALLLSASPHTITHCHVQLIPPLDYEWRLLPLPPHCCSAIRPLYFLTLALSVALQLCDIALPVLTCFLCSRWPTISAWPGLSCFLGCRAFILKLGQCQTHWDSWSPLLLLFLFKSKFEAGGSDLLIVGHTLQQRRLRKHVPFSRFF